VVKTTVKLRTGGKGLPGLSAGKNLFQISASAQRKTSYQSGNYLPMPGFSQQGVNPQNIQILGKHLGSDGKMYAVLSDNDEKVVTPNVSGVDYFTFYISAEKHKLIHQVLCPAPADPDQARLNLGIGEQVVFYFDPDLVMTFPESPYWYVLGAGTVNSDSGSSTTFSASMSPGSATVMVHVRDVDLPTSLGVIPPSGISVTFNRDLGLGTPGTNQIGASTLYWVKVLPDTVSFNNARLQENISPAVTNTWPNHSKFYILDTFAWGFGGICMPAVPDTIAEPLRPISKLYNGTNYQSFSYSLNYHIEYQNQNGDWIPFVPVQTTTQFNADGSCQEIYQGVPGRPQGPWQ